MAAQVDKEKCTGCSLCFDVCPVEAIEILSNEAKIDEDKCVDCGACVDECPNEAISLS